MGKIIDKYIIKFIILQNSVYLFYFFFFIKLLIKSDLEKLFSVQCSSNPST